MNAPKTRAEYMALSEKWIASSLGDIMSDDVRSRHIARAHTYATLANAAPAEPQQDVNAELIEACRLSLCLFTGYERTSLDKAMEESKYPESPYHYLYSAIQNARAAQGGNAE